VAGFQDNKQVYKVLKASLFWDWRKTCPYAGGAMRAGIRARRGVSGYFHRAKRFIISQDLSLFTLQNPQYDWHFNIHEYINEK